MKGKRRKNERAYTYNGKNNTKSSRIDNILISRRLLNSIDSYDLLNSVLVYSDHNRTKININKRIQPKSDNKFFRQEYLLDPIFNEKVKEEIYTYIARNAKRTRPEVSEADPKRNKSKQKTEKFLICHVSEINP